MTRVPLILLAFVISGCAQQIYSAQINMHNACNTSVVATVNGLSNSGRDNAPASISLASQETARVGSFIGFGCCDLNAFLPDNYQITLAIDRQYTTLDRSKVISYVAEDQEKSSRASRFWLLDTKPFCP